MSFLCQYKHSFGVEPGDSGAPVYVEGSTVIEIVGMIFESGVRYHRVGVRSRGFNIPVDEIEWMATIPVGVGVRWSF